MIKEWNFFSVDLKALYFGFRENFHKYLKWNSAIDGNCIKQNLLKLYKTNKSFPIHLQT